MTEDEKEPRGTAVPVVTSVVTFAPGAALWVLMIQAVSKVPYEGEAGCRSRCGPRLGMVLPWESGWGPEPRADGAFDHFIPSQFCECACVCWNGTQPLCQRAAVTFQPQGFPDRCLLPPAPDWPRCWDVERCLLCRGQGGLPLTHLGPGSWLPSVSPTVVSPPDPQACRGLLSPLQPLHPAPRGLESEVLGQTWDQFPDGTSFAWCLTIPDPA